MNENHKVLNGNHQPFSSSHFILNIIFPSAVSGLTHLVNCHDYVVSAALVAVAACISIAVALITTKLKNYELNANASDLAGK